MPEVNVHNAVTDTAVKTIHRRFQSHGTLYAESDLYTGVDPRRFREINKSGHPQAALQGLSKCLMRLDEKATVENLQSELKHLAGHWDRLKASPLDEYMNRTVEDLPDEDKEEV